MTAAFVLFVAAFGQLAAEPAAEPSATRPGADPSFSASIRAEHDNRVPAEVEGLLTTLTVREGSRVKEGDVIGTIDDRHAQAAVDVAQYGFNAADERANDTIEETYALLAADVAKLDYQSALDANARTANTFSPIDIEKKKLDWNRARLQHQKAQKDRRLARLEADVKQAELRAAEIGLKKRTIRAPFDGEVQQVLVHQSEWVNPGDPLLQIVQYDVMLVECFVSAKDWDPSELQGRPVTVAINLARNRQAKVPGHIIYVSQSVLDTTETYGDYLVQAHVRNQRTGNFWLVRPGLNAYMTIHVNQPAVEPGEALSQNASIERR